MKILHPLIQLIWEEKNIPNDWKEGFIIKIPKKETSACVKNASINTLKGTQPHTG